MKGLTERQRMVLGAISQVMEERGYPPTIREIGELLGIRSTNGVNDHLKALERKGYLFRDKSKSRAIRILGNAHEVRNNRDDDLYELPLIGRIAAGMPILAEENREATFRIDPAMLGRQARPSDVFILRVRGDSMIGDGIFDGDLIFVERTETAREGEIVAVMVDGEATVKRFYKEPDGIRLEPSNPDMEPIVISASEGRDVSIIGRIIGVFRQV
jgi:repressor LexA